VSAVGQGQVGVGTRRRRGSDGQASMKGGGVRQGRHTRPDRAQLRQVGPVAGAHCGAGPGGRRAAEARRGRVGVGRAWPVGRGRGRAGVADAWGARSRGGRCVESRQ
jgi:hypothetical protein